MEIVIITLMSSMIGRFANGWHPQFYHGQNVKLHLTNGNRELTIQAGFQYDRLSTNAIPGLKMKLNDFAIIWNFLLEVSYPYIDELLFTKFQSSFFRNGSFKIGSVRVLKSFRAQGDTKHHAYEKYVIPTPPRTPTSKYFANFGFWCNGSIQIHLVLTYLDAIEYCKNLNSFVCKWFRFKDQYGIEKSIYGTWLDCGQLFIQVLPVQPLYYLYTPGAV